MKNLRTYLLVSAAIAIAALFAAPVETSAQVVPFSGTGAAIKGETTKSIVSEIHYRKNRVHYDPSYLNNAEATRILVENINKIGVNNIEFAEVVCYASPEGNLAHNMKLSEDRAIDSKWLLIKNFPELQGHIIFKGAGESWGELRDYVAKDSIMSPATIQKVLSIIDANIDLDSKKWNMQNNLGYDPAVGFVYPYIFNKYYTLLRNSCIVMLHLKKGVVIPEDVPVRVVHEVDTVTVRVVDTVYVPVKEYVAAPVAVEKQKKEKYLKETIFALKTNLLYDAVTMANVEVEIPFAKHWSFMVEDIFPWWEFSKNKYALQNWEMGAEIRYWPRKWRSCYQKMGGWFFAPYGMSGKYDFQKDKDLCWQGTYWSAGLSAGYSVGLGKKNWANLEFSLSAGYLKGSYQHYIPGSEYEALYRDRGEFGNFTWIGPTKAKITFSIPIKVKTKRSIAETKQGGYYE